MVNKNILVSYLLFIGCALAQLVVPTDAEHCSMSVCVNKTSGVGKPNFLLVYIDDLRYMLDGPFAEHAMPNLKSIIETKSIHFENAACPKPICTPSRVAFLTGRRVRQTKALDYYANFNQGFKTVPGILRKKGYDTYAFGKIFDSESFGGSKKTSYDKIDICGKSNRANGECSFTDSISHERCCCDIALGVHETRNEFTPVRFQQQGKCRYRFNDYVTKVFTKHKTPDPYRKCAMIPLSSKETIPGKGYLLYRGASTVDFDDYGIATCGLNKVKKLADTNTPFFVAIGLRRPHLPFSAPLIDWEHFDDPKFDFQKELYWSQTYSKYLPKQLRPSTSESDNYVNKLVTNSESGAVKNSLNTFNFWKEIRHGYYASVRFVDRIVKYIVDEMEAYNEQTRENTHIIITSDHGFLLGEYGRLGKWTLTESTVRVPLTILPSKNLQKLFPAIRVGTRVMSPVDQVDVFPTLLDMAGASQEYQVLNVNDELPGVSLAPYFTDPNTYTRSISVSTYDSYKGRGVVFSLRSKYFRYVMFSKRKIRSRYLFDYRGGPYHRMVERENVAWKPKYAKVREWFERLSKNVRRTRDTKAWSLVKNQKPFDHDWSDERGSIGAFPNEQ